MNANDYIAVFDSGVGGLSVLRELRRILPGERYVYFGDSANAPYGSRPTEEIQALTLSAVERLYADYPVKALVVACNTATSAAIDLLRNRYPQRIILGIEPALKQAADLCPGGSIGVMATEATLREEKFRSLSDRIAGNCRVAKIPAPGLVPLIESGMAHSPEARRYLNDLLAPYAGKLDVLVLGCTHFPFAEAEIREILGSKPAIIHGGGGTARETRRRLAEAGLLREGPGELIMRNSQEDMVRLSYALLESGGEPAAFSE